MEDIKRANGQEADTAETKAAAVVTDSDTKKKQPEGAYVLTLAKPYTYEEKTYEMFTFDFERLIGADLVDIETEMTAVGEFALSPEISTSFLYRLAAKAAGVGSDVILHLPIREFGRVKKKAQDFLISTGFTGKTP